jgi:adenosylcobinamide-GDP ribazoletransferase
MTDNSPENQTPTNPLSAIRNEWHIFLTAVMFLTRISVPKNIDHSPACLQKAPRYFPVIGWIVGGLSALVFLVFNRFVATDVAILASIVAGILATGAFHEDGFADVCDGFGGGWTKEKILVIMKDSRIGAFGAIGIGCMLAAKFLLLKELPHYAPDLKNPTTNIFFNYRYIIVCMIAAHSVSRLAPIFVIQSMAYATDPDVSKSKPVANQKLPAASLIVATLFGLLPMLFLSWHFLFILIPVVYATWSMATWFKKWIGGYTGDCLGAIQQVTEIVFYLAFILVWKYVL